MLFSIFQVCCFLPKFQTGVDCARLYRGGLLFHLPLRTFSRSPAVCFGFVHSSQACFLAVLSVICLGVPYLGSQYVPSISVLWSSRSVLVSLNAFLWPSPVLWNFTNFILRSSAFLTSLLFVSSPGDLLTCKYKIHTKFNTPGATNQASSADEAFVKIKHLILQMKVKY